MTRKDYILIARAMNESRHTGPQSAQQTATHTQYCETLADELKQDNPRFDRARFLRACGVTV